MYDIKTINDNELFTKMEECRGWVSYLNVRMRSEDAASYQKELDLLTAESDRRNKSKEPKAAKVKVAVNMQEPKVETKVVVTPKTKVEPKTKKAPAKKVAKKKLKSPATV